MAPDSDPSRRSGMNSPLFGGITRRKTIQVGGGTIAAALAGCTTLFQDEDPTEVEQQEIPDEPIEAGLQDFIEGPAAVLGVLGRYGTELAVDRINQAGGIAGREIELDVVNEGDEHVENYTQFVEEGKDVTFGPRSSGGYLAMAPHVEDAGVVNVATAGTTTELFEEGVTDPTYTFRAQNYDALESVSAALVAVDQLGADNIGTVAGINQNYAFGHDEQEIFVATIQKLTGAEVIYEGWPELGADDLSTHVTEVREQEPDVLFSSLWGGDATLLYDQGIGADMFSAIDLFSATVTYSPEIDQDIINGLREADTEAFIGDRNWHWTHPDPGVWSPGVELIEEVWEREGEFAPFHAIMDGYGAVTAWATAVEKVVTQLGRWPEQEEIAQGLKGHGWYTPAGYHMMTDWNQQMRPHHSGRLVWSDEWGMPIMDDIQVYRPAEVSPPPGVDTIDWIEGWDV